MNIENKKTFFFKAIKKIKKIVVGLTAKRKATETCIIAMFDGKRTHGGLTDRFRHIMSLYQYCKDRDILFKIHYVHPCDLTLIFQTNEYNWYINPDEISKSFFDTKICSVESYFKRLKLDKEIEKRQHIEQLNNFVDINTKTQYLIYGNCYFAEDKFSSIFRELFKPTELLSSKINSVKKDFDDYEAVVLRFQNLLGDFNEGDNRILTEEEQTNLINICINKIEELYKTGYIKTKQLLITSDSGKFLDKVSRLSYVKIIPGENRHMDYGKDYSIDIHLKPFTDLYILSTAKKITFLKKDIMYDSGFPEFAANIGAIPYNKINF